MVPLHLSTSSQISARNHSTSSSKSNQSTSTNMGYVNKTFQQHSSPSKSVDLEIHRTAAALPAGAIFYEPTNMCSNSNSTGGGGQQKMSLTQFQTLLKCTTCSEVFFEAAKFKQHMFMHDQVNLLKHDPPQLLKPGTYECKFCREIFNDKNKLKIHYSKKHEKEFVDAQLLDQLYQCTMCDLTFVDYTKLVLHQQNHSQRREVYILPKQQIKRKFDIFMVRQENFPPFFQK